MESNQDQLDRVFGALSDRTRRSIILRLAEGPARVGELAEPFDMTPAAVGKHVRILEAAGLVKRHIEGRVHICELEGDELETAEAWLGYYRDYWSDSLRSLADYVENMNDS